MAQKFLSVYGLAAARLRGRVSLNDDYEQLEELFVGFLGVKPVDLVMAIDELKEASGGPVTSVQEMKESIWTVNSCCLRSPRSPPLSRSRNSRVFPIRHPNESIVCGSTATEFFINDREPLKEKFGSKVKLLDFTLKRSPISVHFSIGRSLGTDACRTV